MFWELFVTKNTCQTKVLHKKTSICLFFERIVINLSLNDDRMFYLLRYYPTSRFGMLHIVNYGA